MTMPLRIVLDLAGADQSPPASGFFRYISDLVRGLSSIDSPHHFTVLGSMEHPAPGLEPVGGWRDGAWRYERFPMASGRGALVKNHALRSLYLWRNRCDLYHSVQYFLPLLAPCPIVLTLHDLIYEVFPEYFEVVRSRPYRLLRWIARKRAASVICISQSTVNDAARFWGLPLSRLRRVYHGITFPARTPDRPALAAALGSKTILLSPYNLEPRKNLIALLEAFRLVKDAHPGTELVLFGRAAVSPAREAAFRDAVSRLGIADRLTLTGVVDEDALRWLYANAAVFVFPSLYEGFGYPVLEAMANGACVVVRNASSMAEILGDAGAKLEPLEPAKLAAVLCELLASPEKRRQLGEKARERAREFSRGRMARETLDVYESVLTQEMAA